MVPSIFLPYAADVFLSIPLNKCCTRDRLVWEVNTKGHFSGRSAYKMVAENSCQGKGGNVQTQQE